MDLVAHPLAEVGVVQPAGPITRRVESLHDLHQVWKIDREVRPVETHNILWLDQAVMILV